MKLLEQIAAKAREHEEKARAYRLVLAELNGHQTEQAQAGFEEKLTKAMKLRVKRAPRATPVNQPAGEGPTQEVVHALPLTGWLSHQALREAVGGDLRNLTGIVQRGWIEARGKTFGKRDYRLTKKGQALRAGAPIPGARRAAKTKRVPRGAGSALRSILVAHGGSMTTQELLAAARAQKLKVSPQAIGAALRYGFLATTGRRGTNRPISPGPTEA